VGEAAPIAQQHDSAYAATMVANAPMNGGRLIPNVVVCFEDHPLSVIWRGYRTRTSRRWPRTAPARACPGCRMMACTRDATLTCCLPQIFATTRKEDAAQDDGKRKAGSGGKSGGGGGGPAKKFKPHSKKMQDAADLEKQQFRDRAKERRLGTSKEYQISEETVKSLTVEESKYLGGDMEHTHLVKGLDFALLAKVRSEMDAKEEKRDEQLEKALDDALTKLEATTLLGKTVRNAVLTERRSGRKSIDMFLPGRTTFVFDLDDDFGSEMPTAVSRCVALSPSVLSSVLCARLDCCRRCGLRLQHCTALSTTSSSRPGTKRRQTSTRPS